MVRYFTQRLVTEVRLVKISKDKKGILLSSIFFFPFISFFTHHMLVEAVALLEVYFHVFRACIKLASFFNLFVFSFPNDSNTRHLVRGYKPVIFFRPHDSYDRYYYYC